MPATSPLRATFHFVPPLSSHFVTVGAEGLRHIKNYNLEVRTLLEGRDKDAYVFTAKLVSGKQPVPLSRESFDKDLNKTLVKASALIGKHIRTHSFRAAFITDLLNSGVPIQEAKELVGHRDIKSTYTYQRSSMTMKKARSIISSVNRSRLQD
jgi:site-specific recombinase XerD